MSDDRDRLTGQADGTTELDESRRAALVRMGGLGLAAPAFVALMTTEASEAWAASGKLGPRPKPLPKPKPKPVRKPKPKPRRR
jgi:hypothetical protein